MLFSCMLLVVTINFWSTFIVIQPDTKLKEAWSEPSNQYGWSAVLRNTLPLLVLLWLAPVLADIKPLLPLLLAPLLGLFVYRVTIVMHDCTHYTLFRSRKLNKVMGSLLGAISGVDFHSFSSQHWKHHSSYGEHGDPQGFHYANLKNMNYAEFRWHLVRPLLGLNLRNTFGESVLAPSNLARLFRTGEFALVAFVQLAFIAIVTGFGRYPFLAALPLVSTATFGLFFSQLRGIAEHGIVDDPADAREVRSHAPGLMDRIFLYDINFNYHKEHHDHPQIPSCHLPAFHQDANRAFAPESMLGTLRAIGANRRREHG